MITRILSPAPPTYNIHRLREDALAAFKGRAQDCNEVADQIAIYLDPPQPGDQAMLTSLLAAHNPALTSTVQQKAVDLASAATAYKTINWLAGKTPEQAEGYILANVNDLATARAAIAKLAAAVVALAKLVSLD